MRNLILFLIAGTMWGASITLDDFTLNQAANTTVIQAPGVDRTIAVLAAVGQGPIDYSMSVEAGILNMVNGVQDVATMLLQYDLAGPVLPASATDINVVLRVMLNDGNITTVNVGGLGSGAVSIPGNSANVSYTFPAGDGPGSLSFVFSGDPGWDAAIAGVDIEYNDVPEPSTLALLGSGLVALALLRR